MIRKIFIWTSPIPLLIFWGLWIYAKQVKGWEIFGIMLLFTVPLALSLLMTVMGIVLIVRARKKSEPTANLWFSALLAGSLLLFILALQMMTVFDNIIRQTA